MSIFTTAAVTTFATGTGTDPTAAQTFTVPDNARELVAVRGTLTSTLPNPAESGMGVFALGGDNFLNRPYEWFSEILSAKLGAIDEHAADHEERWWPANLPTKPGANLTATFEPIDALAGDGAASIDAKWSTRPTGMPATKRLATRETASTTSAAAGLTLTDARVITEMTVAYGAATVAADDPSRARLSISSNNLTEVQTITQTTVIHGIEATSGVAVSRLVHADIDIPVTNPNGNTVFSGTFTVDTALGTAGQYAYSVGYIPNSVQTPG